MVAHVLRLRLALLIGSLDARPAVLARRFAGFGVLLVAVAAVCVAVVRLDRVTPGVAATLLTVLGATLAAGYLLVPLFTGAEDPLDPRRFLVAVSDPARVAGATLVAFFVSLPAVAALVIAVAMAVAWTGHGAPVALAVLGGVLFVATCVVGAHCAMAIASIALRDRRSPQLTGLMIVAAGIVVFPAAVFLVSLEWSGGLPTQLDDAAAVLALTPLGAAAALALGAGGTPIASAVIAILTVVALVGGWMLLVRRLLTSSERPVPVRERRGLGWFAVMPGTPGGAVAARSVVYWFGDPRHLANLVVVPIVSVLLVVPLLVVGVPVQTVALIPAPVLALFLGWLAHNDLAYDSTGVWLHFSAGVRGVADRLGRLVPVVLVGVPLLAVAVTVSVWVHDRWVVLPAMIGVCASLYACGLGLSSVSSVLAPYAVSRPDEGPFEQPQRTGGAATQAVVLLGALALSVPSLWWAGLALTGDEGAGWQAFWAGLGVGATVLLVGVLVGGRVFERRDSRIMEFAETL